MKSTILIMIAGVLLFSCQSKQPKEELINTKASIPEQLDISGKNYKVICTMLNHRDSTTALLYGNDVAYGAASLQKKSPLAGEKFTLVTWKQQGDKHWFGANIPGDLLTVETLEIGNDGKIEHADYKKLSGKALTPESDTTGRAKRINFILSQEASIIP